MEYEIDIESDLTDTDSLDKKVTPLKLDSIKKHHCPYEGCHSAFNRPWKLERHVNTHLKKRPYKCHIDGCNKDYINNSHLLRHISLSHTEKKHPPIYLDCPFPNCTKTYSNKWSLKKHCNLHKATKYYTCELCSSTFKKHKLLKNHLSSHLGLKPYTCHSCAETFENKNALKSHERKHKIYKCDKNGCTKEFDKFHALRTHFKNAHPNWLECDFCKKKYLNKYTLTEHVLSHLPLDDRDVIKCPYENCKRTYFYQRNLDHHIRSYHQNVNYQCSICEQTLVNKAKLNEHMKSHLNPKDVKSVKFNKPRKPREDKGLPRKSMAATLSGIRLPIKVEKNLTQNKITEEDTACINSIKEILLNEN